MLQQVAALGDPAAAEGSSGQASSQIPWQSLRFGAAARSPARPLRIAVERAQTTLQTKKKNQCHEEYTLNYCSLKPFQYQHHLLSIILLLAQERRSIARAPRPASCFCPASALNAASLQAPTLFYYKQQQAFQALNPCL